MIDLNRATRIIEAYREDCFDVLLGYDRYKLPTKAGVNDVGAYKLTYQEVISLISFLRGSLEESDLFGRLMGSGLTFIVTSIYQSFDGKELYPSAEEKVAQLLYSIVKNHPFADGNKRIAAFLSIWFLNHNYTSTGGAAIMLLPGVLALMVLLIANSPASDAEIVKKLIVHFLTQGI